MSSPAVHSRRLLWAGFTAILAAGTGFAVRGGILDNWGAEFGFSATQLGVISGAGFTGFCFGIFVGGLIVDKLGYGKLIVASFALHVISAVVTLTAGPGMEPATVYQYLFWGTFIFALANGALEAVANPLVSTLFPENRTHYLNILHASWPLGMVLGGAMGWLLDDRLHMSWKVQLAVFLIPTVAYGILFLGQRFPKSEAAQKGLGIRDMFKDVGWLGGVIIAVMVALFFRATFPTMPAWLVWGAAILLVGFIARFTGFARGSVILFLLFFTHILVGAVELGTDGWIQNITGNILSSEQGKVLFVITSLTMFVLRFCAGWIEKHLKLSPIGLLLVCTLLACLGLNLVSGITTFAGALFALLVYGVGKTFLWPTMLAIVGDRFPSTGAVAMSIMGGLGMMSAGLIGLPGLGYAKDRFASEALQQNAPEVYATSRAQDTNAWLVFRPVTAIDGRVLAQAKAAEEPTLEEQALIDADMAGDRKTLKVDSLIPAVLACIYLGFMAYYHRRGGYRRLSLEEDVAQN